MWRAVFDGDADKRCSSDLKAAGRELVGTRVGRRGKERRRRREKRKRTGLCNSLFVPVASLVRIGGVRPTCQGANQMEMPGGTELIIGLFGPSSSFEKAAYYCR
jgi:hypothetical protein